MANTAPSFPKDSRPENLAEYQRWLQGNHGVEIDEITKNHYQSVLERIEKAVREGICKDTAQILKNADDEFYAQKGVYALKNYDIPIFTKPFSSFFDKTFRINILWNKNFPQPPKSGWAKSPEWYSLVTDLVRSTIVVKYLDAVDFFATALSSALKSNGMKTSIDYRANAEGYYAVHLDVAFNIDIPDLQWRTDTREVHMEIQITTQMKEVVKDILHKYYEQSRLSTDKKLNTAGRLWDYRSDEFMARGLGHIIHHVEGVIVQLRDKERNK